MRTETRLLDCVVGSVLGFVLALERTMLMQIIDIRICTSFRNERQFSRLGVLLCEDEDKAHSSSHTMAREFDPEAPPSDLTLLPESYFNGFGVFTPLATARQ